jgi:hypothetical protein
MNGLHDTPATLPIANLLEPGVYERRRWKTVRLEDEFLDPFLAEKQLEDQRVMVARNRNPRANVLTKADTVRSKRFDAPKRSSANEPDALKARLLRSVCRSVLGGAADGTRVDGAVAKALRRQKRGAVPAEPPAEPRLAECLLDMSGGSLSADRLAAAKSSTSLYARSLPREPLTTSVDCLEAAEVPALEPYWRRGRRKGGLPTLPSPLERFAIICYGESIHTSRP